MIRNARTISGGLVLRPAEVTTEILLRITHYVLRITYYALRITFYV